ncbi:hypothetical protein EW145_g7932 [Phellinidium pouzarii]|uniref:Uncharacterized protein n=1 Tax=Phellinidium pouzarii TaxID=167371 RepID=A0A4S4KC17_9AGAM|nr:hypothetical protein EW145_g7932 [Phellinidium pouzarii]
MSSPDRQFLQPSSSQRQFVDTVNSSWHADANRNMESAALAAVDWGGQHECQIRDFESELASALSNSRAVHNLLVDALDTIENNRKRVDRALVQHIPHIYRELDLSMESLGTLQDRLPEIRAQVRAIKGAYVSGQEKAAKLVDELEWKHAPIQDKLLRIVFSRAQYVSSRDAALLRLAFTLFLVVLLWQLYGAFDGAYRAYRHRLVWGDKLIS